MFISALKVMFETLILTAAVSLIVALLIQLLVKLIHKISARKNPAENTKEIEAALLIAHCRFRTGTVKKGLSAFSAGGSPQSMFCPLLFSGLGRVEGNLCFNGNSSKNPVFSFPAKASSRQEGGAAYRHDNIVQ